MRYDIRMSDALVPKTRARASVILWIALAGGFLAAGCAIAAESYTSSATLRLLPPQSSQVPERLVGAVSGGPIAQQFERLAQKAFSATNLAAIIERLNLYPSDRERKTAEQTATEMRRNITLQPERPESSNYRLSFSYSDAKNAQAATLELVKGLTIEHAIERMARADASKDEEVRHLINAGFGETLDWVELPSLPEK